MLGNNQHDLDHVRSRNGFQRCTACDGTRTFDDDEGGGKEVWSLEVAWHVVALDELCVGVWQLGCPCLIELWCLPVFDRITCLWGREGAGSGLWLTSESKHIIITQTFFHIQ